jgi:uncharacterized repeat protein (TIGR02543 family)
MVMMKKMESRLSKLIICSLFSAFFTVIPPVVITKFQPAFANPGGISSAPLLWLDATDIDSNTATSNPANNATIPTWTDRSPNGNNASVLSGQGTPTYSATSGINNGPAVRFSRYADDSGTVFNVPNVDIRAGTLPDVTIFAVYRAIDPVDGDLFGIWGNDNGAWDRFAICCGFRGVDNGVIGLPPSGYEVAGAGTGTRLLTVVYDGGLTGVSPTQANSGPPNGSSVWFEGGQVTTFTDNTTGNTQPNGTPGVNSAQSSFRIGWDGDGSAFNGWISELIIFGTALSSADIVTVSNYLGSKYDLIIAPTPVTVAATSVETTTAILNGTVNAHRDTTTSITIRYATDSSTVTNNTATSPTVSPSQTGGNTDVSVSASVTGLSPGTTYWFRVSATNSKGTNAGALRSFTTPLSVTYNTQGGSAISSGSTAPSGTISSSPGTPTRSGYAFAGWFTATSGGSAITFPYTHAQTSNFTLYAQWTQLSHSITFFDSNTASASGADGGTAPTSQTGSGVDTVTLNANTLSVSNYRFAGWATSNGSTTVVYNDSATVSITPGLNLSLYPVWNLITQTITYSSGISGQSPTIETVTVNRAANQSFAFSPVSGYRIKSVVVNGVSQGAINSYTFSNVTTNHSLSVEFELIPSSTSTYVPEKSAEQVAVELAAKKIADEKAAEVLATQQKALSDNAAADKAFQALQEQIKSALNNGPAPKSLSPKEPSKTTSTNKSPSTGKVDASKSGISVPEGTILITPNQIASLEIAKSSSGNSANIAISQLKSGQRVKVTVISKVDLTSNSIDLGSTQIAEVTPNPLNAANAKSPTAIAIKPAPKTSASTTNQAQVSVTGAKKNQRVRVTVKSK